MAKLSFEKIITYLDKKIDDVDTSAIQAASEAAASAAMAQGYAEKCAPYFYIDTDTMHLYQTNVPADIDGIILKDDATDIIYKLSIYDGQIRLQQSAGIVESLLFEDPSTGKQYTIGVDNGDVYAEEAQDR